MKTVRSQGNLFRTWGLTIFAVLVLACCKESTSKSTEHNKGSSSSDRTGDESEGIGGYLSNPNSIKIAKTNDGKATVSGKAGTVGSKSKSSIEQVPVGVWSTKTDFKFGSRVPAKILKCVRPDSDGSFSVVLDNVDKTNLLVTAGESCSGDSVNTGASEDGHARVTSLYQKFCPQIFVPGKEASCSFVYNGESYGGSSSLPISDKEWEEVKKEDWYEGSDLQRDEESGLFDEPHENHD